MKIHELGHVVLYVTDIKKMADFYKNTLGFNEIHREGPIAIFSGGRTHHELLLIQVGGKRKEPGHDPGLYHIGFKIGDSHEDIVNAYKELQKHNVTIVGTGDHTVTHSIYIIDPDGNELELYADVSDVWKKDPKKVLAPVKHLDLE